MLTCGPQDKNVGTGLVGAPACGDVMKLQIKVNEETSEIEEAVFKVRSAASYFCRSVRCLLAEADCMRIHVQPRAACLLPIWCPGCSVTASMHQPYDTFPRTHQALSVVVQTFGCGSAIASSSLATEWVQGKNVRTLVRQRPNRASYCATACYLL